MTSHRHLLVVCLLVLIGGISVLVGYPQGAGLRSANHAPVANAGPDQTAASSSVVKLNAGGSTDADGDPLTYTWTLLSQPDGSQASLDNRVVVAPSFKVDIAGTYVIGLVVNDGYIDSASSTVTISARNSRPRANAGRGQAAEVGATVSLDGSASSDADGDLLQFAWSFVSRPAGSMAVLSNTSSVAPTFVPDVRGRYAVQLTVNDGVASSAPDIVIVSTTNVAPVADAGPDQTVSTGSRISLNGSGSTDVNGDSLTYTWSMLSRPAGSNAALSDTTTILPSFVADRSGSYVVQLIVNDGVNASSPDTIVITTQNSAPIAEAGPAQKAAAGSLILLDGGASSDADNDALAFSWAFTAKPPGSSATLAGVSTQRPTFVMDREGTYVVQLIVSDGFTKSAPADVIISTADSRPVADAGPDRLDVLVGEELNLSGVLSRDADNDPLQYAWAVVARPAASVAALKNPDSATPLFTPDVVGDYVLQLIVNDGIQSSLPDALLVRVEDVDSLASKVNVTATDAAAAETGPDPGTFTFSRRRASRRALTIQYSVGGTATNGVDFTPSLSGSVTIPAGQISTTVVVTPVDDSDIEGSETVTLTLQTSSLYSIEGASVATVTIADNDSAVVTASAVDSSASETGPDPGTFNIARTGPTTAPLVVSYSIGGNAGNGSDYTPALNGSVSIPAGQSSVDVTIMPVRDNLVEGPETVVLTLQPGSGYTVGTPSTDSITIVDDPAVVNLTAIDPDAAELGAELGVFAFTRNGGDNTNALTVNYTIGGTAANGLDYALITGSITIPANQTTVNQSIVPLADNIIESPETVALTLSNSANYKIGDSGSGTVMIADDPIVVTVAATDPVALETGADPGVFTFTRSGGNPSSPLQVFYTRSGSATNGVDYNDLGGNSVTIPANGLSVTLTVTPIADSDVEPDETVVATIDPNANYTVGPSSSATVTIHDATTLPLVSLVASDSAASETGPDVGTFRFTRTGATTSSLTVKYAIGGTAANGMDYAAIGSTIVIPSGQPSADVTITPIVDALPEPTELVTLTLSADAAYVVGSPSSASVTITDAGSSCAEGGTMVNGSTYCGAISNPLEIDTWTFTANAGDRIAIHIGEVIDNNDFRPWLRLAAPNSVLLANTWGTDAAAIDVSATVTGTYVLQVASADSGNDGTGTYQLTVAHTPGPITISPGDQGGPLTNGAIHTGDISQGDLDVWTFTATAGDRIAIHIGETAETDDFRPWIRLWAPNGVVLANTWGTDAAAIDVSATVTGTYLVLVASADSGYDGVGSYQLTMAHTPGPITVSPGDQGGPLTNGAIHTGDIFLGDLDVWTFTATAGDRIGIHIGETAETDDYRPWIRLWAPNGVVLANTWGTDAAAIDVSATVTGTYLVLVASADSGYDGIGSYRLTMTHTPGPITVSDGDQGGPLTNGAIHTGEIVQGDLDVWTFTATAGDRIAIHIGETADTDDFVPWIRLWAPNGVVLANTWGTDAAAIDVSATVTGTYLVLVASADSGYDGTGAYQLTMTHTPGPITVSPGDQGGPLTNGLTHTGDITQGDLDVWTFTANAGDRIAVHIGETLDTDDFRPWIRLWAPNGVVLANTWGTDAAAIDVSATVTGTYLVLVASADSGYDGVGAYQLTMTHTPGPISTSPGDQGGALSNGGVQSGEIVQGDLDVWSFTANAGTHIVVQINQTSETDDFRPWIRLWGPNGVVFANTWGTDAATIDVTVNVNGTYLVLVASADSGYDGVGTYNLVMTHN